MADANAVAQLMNLESCLTAGAMFFGVAVSEVTLTLADGRVQRLQFPVPNVAGLEAEDDPEDDLTVMESAVLAVVNRMQPGFVLTNEEIASKAGYGCAGKLRAFTKKLATLGKLNRVNNGYERV